MPEKKQGQVILMSEQQMKTMPILAMRDVCVLPGMLVHLDVSREITKRAIEEAMAIINANNNAKSEFGGKEADDWGSDIKSSDDSEDDGWD